MDKLIILLIPILFACESEYKSASSNAPTAQISCLTGVGLLCSPPYVPKEQRIAALECTEKKSLSEDSASLIEMECEIPVQEPNVDYLFSVSFTQIPQYNSFDIDTAQISKAFQLIKSIDPRFMAQTIPMGPLPEQKSIRFRYKAAPQNTLEEACQSAIAANDTFHEQAKSFDKSCSVRNDCTELSRLTKFGGCINDTISFHFDPQAPDYQRYFGALFYYCPISTAGLGSQYCESGENPPREHHTACVNNQCVVEFETHIPVVKKD